MTGCRYKWPHSTFQFQPARHNSPMVQELPAKSVWTLIRASAL